MTKKHFKIQSQKAYWLEALSLFTDGCLTKEEMEDYKHELAQRLADLVKNNSVLVDVSINEVEVCPHCGSEAIINFAIAKKCSDCRRMI